MHDLIPLGPALPGSLTTAEIDATMAYAEAETVQATRAGLADSGRSAVLPGALIPSAVNPNSRPPIPARTGPPPCMT